MTSTGTKTEPATVDRNGVRQLVVDMEPYLTEIHHAIRALMEVVSCAGARQEAPGEPGDVPFYVADTISAKLFQDYNDLNEIWERLFELTRSPEGKEVLDEALAAGKAKRRRLGSPRGAI